MHVGPNMNDVESIDRVGQFMPESVNQVEGNWTRIDQQPINSGSCLQIWHANYEIYCYIDVSLLFFYAAAS